MEVEREENVDIVEENSDEGSVSGEEETNDTPQLGLSTPKRPKNENTFVEESPARTTRMDEKRQFAKLNDRLSLLLIKQREKDFQQQNTSKQVDQYRKSIKDETDRAMNLYQKKFEDLRRKRDSVVKNADDLKRLANEADQRAENAENDLKEQQDLNNEQKEDIDTLNRELAEKENKIRDDANKIRTLTYSLTKQNQLADKLRDENQDLKLKVKKQPKKDTGLKERVAELQDDLDAQKKDLEDQLEDYREQVVELQEKNGNVENDLRRQFSQQFQDLVEENNAKLAAQKEDLMRHLKEVYEEKLKAYRDELEKWSCAAEKLKEQNNALKEDMDILRSRAESALAEKAAKDRRIEELEKLLEDARNKPVKAETKLKQVIRRLKADFKRKDKEFELLMDVKIALAAELKRYSDLLDEEEARLGYALPTDMSKSRKRRRFRRGEGSAESQSKPEKVEKPKNPVYISNIDFSGKYIVLRNSSIDEIQLEDYQLKTSKKGHEFSLSDIKLEGGESVKIFINSEDEKDDSLNWTCEEGELLDAEDKVLLLVGAKTVHSKNFNLLGSPEASMMSEESKLDLEDEDDEEDDEKKGDCSIM